MKYFAKYLPVEGEIKGWCRYKPTGEIFYQQFGNNAMYDKPNGKLQTITSSLIAYEKVKLFLCSRDIDFNEECHVDVIDGRQTDDSFKLGYPIKHFFGVNALPWEGAYKVIGEISPDAGWVKEGDEFEEDNLKFRVSDHPPFKGWLERTVQQFVSERWCTKRAVIKGPCGHFH